jgi:dTDP-4-dehydrorhamnose reductase
MKDRPEISVVSDQIGSPTYAADLASCIMQIICSADWYPGVYNFSNEGQISWFEFALEIARITASSCVVHPIPTSAYPTPAQRPQYSVMDKHKICKTYGLDLNNWKESLSKCINELNKSIGN